MTGTLTVMPWLPLPELLMAASVQPAILASDAAAVSAIAYAMKWSPNSPELSFRMVLPTQSP